MFIAFFTNPYAFAFDYFRIANDYSCLSADLNFFFNSLGLPLTKETRFFTESAGWNQGFW
ncbi:MAG: hypothetical protein EAZ78_02675 [Oscillatoriales cyanobacterium]|nr:MAG: hypothetical protein EA000_07560 [Oscillatoriales cyanobacterium]TAD99254.1 MAG: hypothetical protein EAZ98_04880 [Oscillatoriales cyanobacterium]TAE06186.1 MAG: hypothetical protein EAZ96_02995 [Oscillatoriales cyanobacterium]TAF06381.1 MAG: hypothetical protein EAZ78_02675 [Oscillatoriales cyanobacterium]TAF46812.1 MAG: hypothetical protein EAZ68_03085 [Oscillatoriales cyanobacterium]